MGWMGSQSDHHQDHVFKHRINGNGINNLNLRKWLVVFNGKLVGKYTIMIFVIGSTSVGCIKLFYDRPFCINDVP